MSYYDNLLACRRIVIDTIISLLWIIMTYEQPWNNLGRTLCTVCNTTFDASVRKSLHITAYILT